MKKISLLILLVIAFVSCEKEPKLKQVAISGKILNSTEKTIKIKSIDNVVKATIEISEDGNFSDNLQVNDGMYLIEYGNYRTQIYFEESNDFVINFDGQRFHNTIEFSGIGYEASKYLIEKNRRFKDTQSKEMSLYSLSEDEYKDEILKTKEDALKILNEFEGLSSGFKKKEKRNLNYTYINKLENFQMYHSFVIKNPDFKVSENFLSEKQELDFENIEDFIYSSDYRYILASYYRQKSFDLMKGKSFSPEVSYINTVGQIENETIKNGLLLDYINLMLPIVEDKEVLYKSVLKYSSDKENNQYISELYENNKRIESGQPSPIFENYLSSLNDNKSLSDFRGSYCYIYIWSSAFESVNSEFQTFNEVASKYANKKIIFINICLDNISELDQWKNIVAKNELKGVSLIADKGIRSDFIKNYSIKKTPSFILIDSEGKIINSNAPKPSNPKLEKLLSDLNV